jgi:DNA-binding XRE family transcriptional regulator
MDHNRLIWSFYGSNFMPKPRSRLNSRISRSAILLLGRRIRLARTERRMSTADLAERAQISRGLLQRIEKGDPACQIGAVFEAAAIVGVTPLGADDAAIAAEIADTERLMALLPKHVHGHKKSVNDDF